jgi:hypothetical protein
VGGDRNYLKGGVCVFKKFIHLHRLASSLLPIENYISPDLPPHVLPGASDEEDNTFLDFYINGKLGWGIELLCEGRDIINNKLLELKSCRGGGVVWEWVGVA